MADQMEPLDVDFSLRFVVMHRSTFSRFKRMVPMNEYHLLVQREKHLTHTHTRLPRLLLLLFSLWEHIRLHLLSTSLGMHTALSHLMSGDRVLGLSLLSGISLHLLAVLGTICSLWASSQSYQSQEIRTSQMQDIIAKFWDGRVTVLVSTSVAEEGLVIRQCNVVICFDLAKTVLAYIQSRGRARKPGSDYILIVERY